MSNRKLYIFISENIKTHEILIGDSDKNIEVYSPSYSKVEAEKHFVSLHHEFYDGRQIVIQEVM